MDSANGPRSRLSEIWRVWQHNFRKHYSYTVNVSATPLPGQKFGFGDIQLSIQHTLGDPTQSNGDQYIEFGNLIVSTEPIPKSAIAAGSLAPSGDGAGSHLHLGMLPVVAPGPITWLLSGLEGLRHRKNKIAECMINGSQEA